MADDRPIRASNMNAFSKPDTEGEDPMPSRRTVTRLSTTSRGATDGPARKSERPTGSRCRPDCHRPTQTQAHCSVCHVTFGGVSSGFDKHRDDGRCLNPADLGMVERDGVWRTPMSDEARAALRGEPKAS